MINIPTELLRTLVAVVDLRSFTKAAHALGVTQPAVSAQIKRLQVLLGCDLFDKSAPGVSLTPSGKLVVNFARRMLTINDQIVDISVPRLAAQAVRIGVPGDFAAVVLLPFLAEFKTRYPGLRFSIRSGHFDSLSRDLRQGELDLLVGLAEAGGMTEARHQKAEPMVWMRSASLEVERDAPVPLVTIGKLCAYHRIALTALAKSQWPSEIVFIGASESSVVAAVRSGLGVGAMPRRLVQAAAGVEPWDDAPLPPLNDVYCGICISENGDQFLLEELADAIYEALYPPAQQLHLSKPVLSTDMA